MVQQKKTPGIREWKPTKVLSKNGGQRGHSEKTRLSVRMSEERGGGTKANTAFRGLFDLHVLDTWQSWGAWTSQAFSERISV